MAAFYVDEEEEEVWKCPKHQSKRHRSGICPTCLRERLSSLCPDCANVRPCGCSCSSAVTTSSSSSSSSFLTRFSSLRLGIGNSIENEPAFRRSRSVAVPFTQSKSKSRSNNKVRDDERIRTKRTGFWGWLKKGWKKSSSGGVGDTEAEEERRRRMMSKSRSVAVTTSDYGNSKVGVKWYFRMPIKVPGSQN